MVNTCNSSVNVLVEFIAVLFRALQKFRVRAAMPQKKCDRVKNACNVSSIAGCLIHEVYHHYLVWEWPWTVLCAMPRT